MNIEITITKVLDDDDFGFSDLFLDGRLQATTENLMPFCRTRLTEILDGAKWEMKYMGAEIKHPIQTPVVFNFVPPKCEHDFEMVDAGARVCNKCNIEELYVE